MRSEKIRPPFRPSARVTTLKERAPLSGWERDARLLDLEKKNSQMNQRNSELSLMLDKVLVLVFRD
jgi:hypothetical protein